jgi:hypothetical protein
MAGAKDSIGGFLGTSSGPTVDVQNSNPMLQQLQSAINDPEYQRLTNGVSGTQAATDAVQSNGILGQLFGQGGALSGAIGKENQLQNQGYQLTPEDQTMYGQASGDVARLFGQQENSAANSLAMRGLASAPTGAAGATFSGLAGNKNEMLAKAQQQIMQQRYQNTQQQIQQQQQFISQLGGQAQNAIQGQYGRQLAGEQSKTGALAQGAGLQTGANAQANQSNLAAKNFEQANKPANFADYYLSGVGQGLQQQGNNTSNPFNSGSGSPYSIFSDQQKNASSMMGGGSGGGGASMFAMA